MTVRQVTNGSDRHSEGLLALQQGTSLPEHCLEAITEFSPDWSYPEVSILILLCGVSLFHAPDSSHQNVGSNPSRAGSGTCVTEQDT